MNKIKVRCTFTEEALGMTSPTKELLANFIELQKKRLGKKAAIITDEKTKEEMAALNLQIEKLENEGRGYTVFPRLTDALKESPKFANDPTIKGLKLDAPADDIVNNPPIFWDMQMKGFFKDAFKALLESDDEDFKKEKCGFTKWSSDRTVDQLIFPGPRIIVIHLPEGGKMGRCDRSLKAKDNHGVERMALASSESVPVDSWVEFEVTYLRKSLKKQILKAFEYGTLRGFAGWRNSGKGRFNFEVIEDK